MLEKPIPPVKCIEPDDPMEFNGVVLPGDTSDAMTECFIEEYILQGFADEQILRLFREEEYAGTHAVWVAKGDEYVKAAIAKVRAVWGQFRFRTETPSAPTWEV